MKTLAITIDGMSCQHCVMHVNNALRQIPDLQVTKVEINSAIVEVVENEQIIDKIKESLQKIGYNILKIE